MSALLSSQADEYRTLRHKLVQLYVKFSIKIGSGRVRTIRPEITADRGWGSITGRVRHCVGRVG